MEGKQRVILCLASMAALLAGCEAKHEVQQVGKPTARLAALKFQDVKAESATLVFDVEIENPYATNLPLTSLNYSITSGANAYLSTTTDLKTAVPPNSTKVVTLPAKVDYLDMLRTLNGKPGSKIPYKAELRVSVDAPRLGLIKLPSWKQGELDLPDIPQLKEEIEEDRTPDVVFVPTPQEVVDKMLELAEVKKDDLVYDLGCGDGRIVVTAAKKYGCKAFGFDIDPQRIKESLENVAKNNVGDLVTIVRKDIFTLDLSKVNVVTLYLLPSLNVRLIPQLDKLQPGSRIVSHDFDMEGVQPDKVVQITSGQNNVEHTVYLWTAPLKKIHEMEPASVGSDSSGSGSQ